MKKLEKLNKTLLEYFDEELKDEFVFFLSIDPKTAKVCFATTANTEELIDGLASPEHGTKLSIKTNTNIKRNILNMAIAVLFADNTGLVDSFLEKVKGIKSEKTMIDSNIN